MGFEFGDIPEDCFSFCLSQYERFNVYMPKELSEIINSGASATFYCLDCVDPYLLLSGVSDVSSTDEWSVYAYEIIERDRVYEIDPTHIETFRHIPGQDEETFNFVMSHPGLDALPAYVGTNIREIMDGEYGSDCFYSVSTDADALLKSVCSRADGSVNLEMRSAYFELAAWAAYAWIVGPLGRPYRHRHHDIFNIAMDYGEAILVDGSVLCPEDYRKLARPPRSCVMCGLPAWCVEMISSASGTRYLCEHCLSEGMPPSAMSTCGSKRCLLTACHYHPYHHLGSAGLSYARRDHGQLGAAAKGDSVLRIKGGRSF